ncbi:LysR substrate-binding domain-containing protein [Rhizobium sp. R693]|uniref:LysR substrate-binding domain-containing protein n=1 Tax=Rhizobium sp. R693 TaxID=1764276 RepID=UPI001FD8A01F|nr:LysR substrate-binding domain-containing protein [Rhizobium sp. R693]
MPHTSALFPSMTALRVILAIAERGSTTAAAESIHLSQSAVSKQLLTLETALAGQIFERRPSGMVPTELGRIYLEQAQVAVKAMEEAAFRAALLQPESHTLRLKVLPILGDRWLLPRFSDFSSKHPEIDVQYTTFSTDHPSVQPDGSFRFGRGPFPGEDAMYIFGKNVRLVCSPAYLQRVGRCENIEDAARGVIIEHPATPLQWSDLVDALDVPDLKPSGVLRFDYYTLVLRAAISGQGFALVPWQLVEEELRSGSLVNPGGLGYTSQVVYWFATPSNRKPTVALKLFLHWLEANKAKWETIGPVE